MKIGLVTVVLTATLFLQVRPSPVLAGSDPAMLTGQAIHLGRGWDTALQAPRGEAVLGTERFVVAPQARAGTQHEFNMNHVTTAQGFRDAVSNSLSFGVSVFGFGAQFATHMMQAVEFQENSQSLLLTTRVAYTDAVLRSPSLTAQARALLASPDGAAKFRRAFGDTFVASVTFGGYFAGVVNVTSSDSATVSDVSTKFSTSLMFFNMSFDQTHINANWTGNSSVSVRQFALGVRDLSPVSSVDQLITNAKKFTEAVIDYPVPLGFTVLRYDVLPEYQMALVQAPVTYSAATYRDAQGVERVRQAAERDEDDADVLARALNTDSDLLVLENSINGAWAKPKNSSWFKVKDKSGNTYTYDGIATGDLSNHSVVIDATPYFWSDLQKLALAKADRGGFQQAIQDFRDGKTTAKELETAIRERRKLLPPDIALDAKYASITPSTLGRFLLLLTKGEFYGK